MWHYLTHKSGLQWKTIQTMLLLLLCLLLLSGVFNFPQSLSHQWQTQGQAYLTEALENSAKTFLIARGINAGISVLQSVTISPVVAAVSVGEVLDPINDLIERFSWIMLVVTIALGIQQLLLQITGEWQVQHLFYMVSALLMIAIWWRASRPFILKLVFALLLLRFSIPLMLVGVEQIDQYFLQQQTKETIASLAIEQQRLENNFDESWLSAAREKLQNLKQKTEKVLSKLIHLATLFVFKTLVLPILVWMLIWFFFKNLLNLNPLAKGEAS